MALHCGSPNEVGVVNKKVGMVKILQRANAHHQKKEPPFQNFCIRPWGRPQCEWTLVTFISTKAKLFLGCIVLFLYIQENSCFQRLFQQRTSVNTLRTL